MLYDPEAGERLSTPALDRTTGIIIHLPAGRGTCTLYEIDLVAGYRAAQLANEIRSVRREARRWIQPLPTLTSEPRVEGTSPPVSLPLAGGGERAARSPAPTPSLVGAGDRRAALLERYSRLDADRQIAFRARGVDRDDLDAVEAALDALEPVAVDDKLLRDSASVAELNGRLLVITPEQRARLNMFARQALKGQGQPIVFRFEPFTRNVHICAGLLACCEAGYDDDQVRTLVEAALADEVQASIPTGAVLGAMTLAEAVRFDEMARAAIPQATQGA